MDNDLGSISKEYIKESETSVSESEFPIIKEKISVENEIYGINKPVRTIIRTVISHDKN